MPSSRGSSQPRDRTQVSHIAGRFCIVSATRKAHEYWSGWPVPSPGDLCNPTTEPGSPALQADSLPAELPGKPDNFYISQIIPEHKKGYIVFQFIVYYPNTKIKN